ncbi:MAG: hypothetical protein K0R57_5436 [Paenibacillaceae bacterium]|jgi:putative aldouronate transport system substrate-binding protein|nr:hypothetical protein [Paenibacillaceae bacterium]
MFNMMSKKLTITLLSAILMIAPLASGCSSSEEGSGGKDNPGSTQASGTPGASSGTSAANADSGIPKETVKLKLVNFGDTTPRRTEFFNKDLHDRVLKELNIDLTVDILPWDSKNPQLMIASGENFATFSSMAGAFTDSIAKGWIAEIPQASIDKYCQDLNRVRAPYGFETFTFKGKIYGVPLGKVPFAGGFQTLMVRQDLLDEVGVAELKTFGDLENAMKLVKAKHPDYTMMTEFNAQKDYLREVINPNQLMTSMKSTIDDGQYIAYLDSMSKDDKVYSWFESEAFKNLAAIHKNWKDAGYFSANDLANTSKLLADWKAGKALAYSGSAARPMEELPGLQKAVPNAKLKLYKFGSMPLMYASNSNAGYIISIGGAKYVDRYLMLFNWMNKNQEIYDFLAYGIKDRDYVLEGERVKKLTADNFFDEWQIANTSYKRYATNISDEFIAGYKKNDEGAVKAKNFGFNFDASTLQSEIAKMTAVYQEKLKPIQYGFLEYDKYYPAAIKEMKDAGLDKYMAEMQKQFTAWYAAQPR